MNNKVISVENLSKCYQLGQIGTGTLSHDLEVWWARLRGKPNPLLKIGEKDHGNRQGQTLWALRNVSFTVEQGEVLGIIGRNGAGKSTLLKILSRVTAPTSGVVKVKGRIASLLEVGTGFHPELSGRENIFLNGAILGMSKKEVTGKLDEIVAFAEVEKFLDTPVKRYSSGMYVRLAFAVAAHLDPEILVVDEVLAVGDAEFQKKCLGKMGDVANEGRTVLFVSHNMQAITSLCKRVISMYTGTLISDKPARIGVQEYLNSIDAQNGIISWNREEAPGDETIRLMQISILNKAKQACQNFLSQDEIIIRFTVDIFDLNPLLIIGFDLLNADGIVVMRCYHNDSEQKLWPKLSLGKNLIEVSIPPKLLNSGTYYISPKISLHCTKWIVNKEGEVFFRVDLSHGISPFWNALNGSNRAGVIAPILSWRKSAE